MKDDTIKRQAVLDLLIRCAVPENGGGLLYQGIKQLPSAERHGKWVDGKRIGFDGTFHWFRQCSECLYEREDDNPEKDTNYCPNCGALMVDEEEDIPMEYFENGGI